MNQHYSPKDSYVRVATATPPVSIGDVKANIAEITKLYREALEQDVSLVVFPELSITGYSLGDTVRQNALLARAEDGLIELAKRTKGTNTAMVVGLPLRHGQRLYNCAALLAKGVVQGIVTKSNLPTYSEFYEKRWYEAYKGNTLHAIGGTQVPFGQQLLFTVGDVLVGVEICEDLWVANQPSRALAAAGALVIANPSASPELVGKCDYRRQLIRMTSAAERVAYIYAGADWTESTTDIVMGGHAVIAENGSVLAERQPFAVNERLLVADIDIDHLQHDRMQDTTTIHTPDVVIIDTGITRQQIGCVRQVPTSYFLPANETDDEKTRRFEQIIAIQAHGLARRMLATKSKTVVLGLSGGLDSTLALLVAQQAITLLETPKRPGITAITMPGPASSDRTQTNAVKLAKAMGVTSVVLPIDDMVRTEQNTLEHSGEQDVTYENMQARARTALLFNYANSHSGLVVGTGDLSEIALGWCTYGGDQLNHYNVNASIPKTLVKDLVLFAAQLPQFAAAKPLLTDIVNTPISPELTTTAAGNISQQTEQLIGPYILHDFFLYHVVRYGDAPAKIKTLATQAFAGQYTLKEITHWLAVFYKRFASNQFKRSAMPDGPKVGSIALSPRGDWRMPSDMSDALWQ